jgi:hypothetical protein
MLSETLPCWGDESEKKFIDGLGTHSKVRISMWSKRQWLQGYIRAHRNSPHKHHRIGVKYAKAKLAVAVAKGVE